MLVIFKHEHSQHERLKLLSLCRFFFFFLHLSPLSGSQDEGVFVSVPIVSCELCMELIFINLEYQKQSVFYSIVQYK